MQHPGFEKRLGNKCIRPRLHELILDIGIVISGNNDNRNIGSYILADRPDRCQPIHIRHLPVQNHRKKIVPALMRPDNTQNRFRPRQHPVAAHPQLRQQRRRAFTDRPVIVHHQNRQTRQLDIRLFHLVKKLEGNRHDKPASLAQFTFDLDRPVHHTDNIIRNRQTQASSLNLVDQIIPVT